MEEYKAKSLMAFELAVDDSSFNEVSLHVIGTWRPGKMYVVVESFTTVACSNVEAKNITMN